MVWHRRALKAYRALLFLYPAEFRHEYGEEMERLFVARLGSEPPARLWLEALTDAALLAPQEHIQILAADLKHGARALAKAPGLVLAALLATVLGVSASTTVFSLVHAVLIRSLPYGNPERLAYLWTPTPTIGGSAREVPPLYSDIVAWQKTSQSFASITTMQRYIAVLTDGSAQRIGAVRVPGNFFQTLEAGPQFGRTIDAADDRPGADLVAVISDAFWHSKYGGNPDVIGKTIRADGLAYRVVGVMPREFSYPHGNDFPGQYQFASLPRTDLWVPHALTPKQLADPEFDGIDAAIGRLRAGVTLAQARAELSAIESRLSPSHPEIWRNSQALLVPFLETSIGPVLPLMRLLTGAVCLILLMACGNLASLLMARAANRVHEIGVRTALGAERSRLVRLLLTESLMLSATGGLLALPLTYAALKAVLLFNPGDIPRLEEATPDLRVFFFGLALSVGAGILAGIYPALSASRVSVCQMLRNGGRGVVPSSLRVRNALVTFQIAGAVVLLAGAGILIRSYLNVQSTDKGFSQSTLTMSINLDPQITNSDPVRREAMERIQHIPGVQSAGSIDDLPLSTYEDKGVLEIEGDDTTPMQLVAVRETAGDYFRTMQIGLLEGRYTNDGDVLPQPGERAQAVAVSESFARMYFQNRNAVGHRVRINESRWSTIVGVVGDVRHASLEEAPEPIIYYPNGLADCVVIRTAAPAAVIPSIRKTLSSLNAGISIADVLTMNEYVDQATARRRFQTAALTSFASVAVILALVGFYGLLSYVVIGRTAEVGIRMALGASRGAVVRMVLAYGLKLTVAGLGIGLGLALLLARMMASFLYGVRPVDPLTFFAVPAFTLAVALIACIAPAWKASCVDPVNALRQQ